MKSFFSTGFFGKQSIVSHYDHCIDCHKLAALGSYTTVKFLALWRFPLIPIGKPTHIVDECSHCGHRSIIPNGKYRKKRKEDLAVMMDAFRSEGDDPYVALNGLQTLLVYNEEAWFENIIQSFGQRFDTHVVVQMVIAQGLCRFGHYKEAETYCRKAIVLGAGPHAEELLSFCQTQLEKKESGHIELLSLRPESIVRPYAFSIAVTAGLFISLIVGGISSTSNHAAWLVNGSDIPYSIEIDGNLYRLRPYERKCIKLNLGKHLLQAHELPGHTEPISFSYTTSLLRQKLENRALVLNPDQLAVMVSESLIEGQTTNSFYFGESINVLGGIDYPFSSFPVWVGSKHSAQTRLFNHVPVNHVEMVEFLRAHGASRDAVVYARRALAINPSGVETEELLKIATRDLTTDQVIDFLRHGKSVMPPLPAWHCFYQNFMEVRQPEHDLQTEYAMFCKTHPDQPETYFLLGRVARNRSTAKLLFEKSEKGTGSRGLGYHAIAYDLLCSGQFKDAQTYSKKALEQSPDHPKFQELDQQIHLALRQYDPPLHQVRINREADPGNGEWVAEEIKYLTLLGEHQAATETMNSFSGNHESWNAYFHAARFYAVGNMDDYLGNLLISGRENARLLQLLHAGDVDAASKLLGKNEDTEYTAHLILYCAANYHGFPRIADAELANAIAELENLTSAHGRAALILSSETPPSVEQLLSLRILPSEKALICASLGYKFPAQQKPFFNLSRKFNYTPEYPQLLLKQWTRGSVRPQ